MAYFDRKDDYHHIRWSREVMQRDHYTCQICGRRGVELNSHHIKSYADNTDDRYDVDNGTCLCATCHNAFHNVYGKGKNTEEQFEEFETAYGALIKAAQISIRDDLIARKIDKITEAVRIADKIVSDLDGYGELDMHNSP